MSFISQDCAPLQASSHRKPTLSIRDKQCLCDIYTCFKWSRQIIRSSHFLPSLTQLSFASLDLIHHFRSFATDFDFGVLVLAPTYLPLNNLYIYRVRQGLGLTPQPVLRRNRSTTCSLYRFYSPCFRSSRRGLPRSATALPRLVAIFLRTASLALSMVSKVYSKELSVSLWVPRDLDHRACKADKPGWS